MDKQQPFDHFTVKRSSIIKDEYLLIIFCLMLYSQVDSYINLSNPNYNTISGSSIEYVLIFSALVCLYFPKKINFNQKIILIISAFLFRLKGLFYLPILSSDLHRNLLFGSILADGWNPYLWTIEQLPKLLQQGLITKVSYTHEWASHSYDYPSLAILFFALITFLVPTDNFSAFILAKLVLMIFDLMNAYLIYQILSVHFKYKELSKKIALLYLINPLSIFWVNIEGQFEPIPLFFILISFYFLFYIPSSKSNYAQNIYKFPIKEEYLPYLIGFSIGCGVLFKYFPLIFTVPIVFYFGRRFSYTLNFLIGLIATIVFLSFPFLESSFYITNFLLFQITRNSNFVSDANYNIGFNISLPIFLLIVVIIGIAFVYSYHKKWDLKLQTSILGFFSVYLFIYVNNSIFSWYVIWIYGSVLFINSNYDEFFQSLMWIFSLIILIFIWRPDLLISIIQIIVFSFVITLERVRTFIKSILFFNKNEMTSGMNKTNTPTLYDPSKKEF